MGNHPRTRIAKNDFVGSCCKGSPRSREKSPPSCGDAGTMYLAHTVSLEDLIMRLGRAELAVDDKKKEPPGRDAGHEKWKNGRTQRKKHRPTGGFLWIRESPGSFPHSLHQPRNPCQALVGRWLVPEISFLFLLIHPNGCEAEFLGLQISARRIVRNLC